jgi:hypothetical protein
VLNGKWRRTDDHVRVRYDDEIAHPAIATASRSSRVSRITGGIPVFLSPTRNRYGILGRFPQRLEPKAIAKIIAPTRC